jgi:hypothetical protein
MFINDEQHNLIKLLNRITLKRIAFYGLSPLARAGVGMCGTTVVRLAGSLPALHVFMSTDKIVKFSLYDYIASINPSIGLRNTIEELK